MKEGDLLRAVLVYNSKSWKRKAKKNVEYIEKEFNENGFELSVWPTKCEKNATKLATEACNQKYDLLIVAGGDGTLNEAVNGIVGQKYKPKIGLIPIGTTNDVAKNFGIPKKIKEAVKIILENNARETDVGKINDDYFLYVTAAGVYTRISYTASSKAKKVLRKGAYILEGFKELIGSKRFKMKIISDDLEIEDNFVMILITNSNNVGGRKLIEHNFMDDGHLEFIAFKNIPFRNTLRIIRVFLFGFSKKVKGTVNFRAKNYKIICDDSIVWNIDGESACKGCAEVSVLSKEIEFIVPKRTNIVYKTKLCEEVKDE